MAPPEEEDWIEREPGLVQAGHELSRVMRRARNRPLLVLAIALAGTGLFLFKRARAQPLYEATVVVRIEETELGANVNVQRVGALVDYVWNIALSRETILQLCDQFELYEDLADKPDARIDEFRNWLSVDARKNYFLLFRMDDDELRTARVEFSFTDPDPSLAAEVAVAAAKAYMAFEIEQRRKAGLDALDAMRLVEGRAMDALKARKVRKMNNNIELANDLKRDQSFEMVLDMVRSTVTELELLTRASEQELGLGLDIVTVDKPRMVVRGTMFWVVSGTFVFTILLLLSAIAVGAFDSRVTSLEDVERLGFDPVGHIPAFAGQEYGSLAKRLDSARRG